MRSGSLERLVDDARALPGERQPIAGVRGPLVAAPGMSVDVGDMAEMGGLAGFADVADLAALRKRVGRVLAVLAERLEPALIHALERAAYAWDQFDDVTVLDATLDAEVTSLHAAAAALSASNDAVRRACGRETYLVLHGALGLATLAERRLATLVRLRLRSGDPSLLPNGRPFLDVAAALAEAARGWT